VSSRTLLFTYSGTTFMLPADLCREVFPLTKLLPLPATHTALLGLTEVRGRAVPLLDLAALHALHGRNPSSAQPDATVFPLAMAAPSPALALLVNFQGELLAFPVAHMLGVSTIHAPPSTRDGVFERIQAQGRDVEYIHPSALLGTVRTRLLQA